jgi:hypothetical protein
MSYFKNLPVYILYYSDTDSIWVDKPLDLKWVSNKLVDWK